MAEGEIKNERRLEQTRKSPFNSCCCTWICFCKIRGHKMLGSGWHPFVQVSQRNIQIKLPCLNVPVSRLITLPMHRVTHPRLHAQQNGHTSQYYSIFFHSFSCANTPPQPPKRKFQAQPRACHNPVAQSRLKLNRRLQLANCEVKLRGISRRGETALTA